MAQKLLDLQVRVEQQNQLMLSLQALLTKQQVRLLGWLELWLC
jgi:hypothetical protein